MGTINVPDGSWGVEFELSNLESFQEFAANEVVCGSWVHENLSFGCQNEDFKGVGIHSDLYLLTKVLFNFNKHAQAIRVACFKNLSWVQPPLQFLWQLPYWWWPSSGFLTWFDFYSTDPSGCFRVVIIIRSFITFINICLAGFGIFLLLIGWFIQTVPEYVALFVAGETTPFFTLLLHLFWGCGACSTLGVTVSISRTVPISPCAHGIWVRQWHFNSQDFGKFCCQKAPCFLLGWLLGCISMDVPDVLDCSIILVVLVCPFSPSCKIAGADYLVKVIHHIEREFGSKRVIVDLVSSW